jgi:branched-chain amino acid transport system substrate-binding protein
MLGETDGLVLRNLARRYPSVTFLLGDSMAQEATLRDPAPNVFRFGPDEAQATAGLGSYAFHRLGWRRAAIVVRDSGQTWPQAAGFVAEFCSLGGKVDRVPIPASGPARAAAAIPKGVDGVVALTGFVGETAAFVGAYAARQPDLARHLLLGPNSLVFADRKTLTALGAPLNGVVSSITAEYQTSPRWRAFRRSYLSRNTNVTVPDNAAGAPLFVAYYNAAEALATALGRSHGGGHALRRELAATALESLAGPVRLDRNRQAVVSNYLVRFDPQSPSLLPTIRVVPNVEQSFGGYFTSRTPGPSLTAPGCHRAMPPPWARP